MHFRTSPDTSRGLENVFAVAALLATAESLTSLLTSNVCYLFFANAKSLTFLLGRGRGENNVSQLF